MEYANVYCVFDSDESYTTKNLWPVTIFPIIATKAGLYPKSTVLAVLLVNPDKIPVVGLYALPVIYLSYNADNFADSSSVNPTPSATICSISSKGF